MERARDGLIPKLELKESTDGLGPTESRRVIIVEDEEEEELFESVDTFIAGAVSGLVAESLAHPFDTVSMRAKVHPSSVYGTFSGAFRLIYAQGDSFSMANDSVFLVVLLKHSLLSMFRLGGGALIF